MNSSIVSLLIFTNPKLQYENTYFRTNDNLIIKIIQYINDNDCIVQFQHNGYVTHTSIENIYSGNVYNPYNSPKKLSVMYSSKTDEWYTPLDFYQELDNEFHFNLDPCSTDENHKCENYYTISDNGLNHSWAGYRVFCNPPYSEINKKKKKKNG